VNNQYHFITRWRLEASAEEIFDILDQPLEYPRWWPSVYLSIQAGGPGTVRMITRGWLPYRLKWEARTTDRKPPHLLAVEATGDLEGRGIWSVVSEGEFTTATFDWKVTARKPLLRRLSFLFRPAFEANHRWAMQQGFRSLELELARSRANTVEEMSVIPDPPVAILSRLA
jgi:hypothetical protein